MSRGLPHSDLADRFRAARPQPVGPYLDSASASRASSAVIEAMHGHLRRESISGSYIAEASIADVLERGRADLAALLGRSAADLAYTESARSALATLLAAFDLPRGSEVLVSPGEFGVNLELFERAGHTVTQMAVGDELGRVDVDALAHRLRNQRPALVHLCYLGSHRGVVQPAAGIVDACRLTSVPVVVDAAQAVGHLECALDADAVYGTSRKWLAGPRGIGFLTVRPGLLALEPDRLESHSGSIAGRLGLAVAVREHLEAGPERVRARLAAIGAATRTALDGAGGWSAVEPVDTPSAITTLRPPEHWTDQDVLDFRNRLLEDRSIATTYCGPERAPLETKRATLRLSPNLDITEADLDRVAEALRSNPSSSATANPSSSATAAPTTRAAPPRPPTG